MKKNHLLGLDIAQLSAVAQLEAADGSPCWSGTLRTDQTGWQQLEGLLRERHLDFGAVTVLIEATGVYHLPWAQKLSAAGAEVYVLNPLLAAKLESVANALRGHKTDRVDVAKLCEVGRLHQEALARFRYRPDPARQGLRELDHARAKLRQALTNLKKSLRSHLELVFPALLVAKINPGTQQAARILQAAPTAGAWGELPLRQRRELAGAKAAALDEACGRTLADEALATACVPALRVLLQAQQAMAAQLAACQAAIQPRLPAGRVALIRSLPGFGERTAAVMATYLPADFAGWGPRKKITSRVQAFFGCDPRLRQSGQWTGKVKMSKRGIGAARTALFQAAFCSLETDPENAAYYQTLRRGGPNHPPKGHKAAMVDLMRKQLRRLVAVLCSGQPFIARWQPQRITAA